MKQQQKRKSIQLEKLETATQKEIMTQDLKTQNWEKHDKKVQYRQKGEEKKPQGTPRTRKEEKQYRKKDRRKEGHRKHKID